MPALLVVVQTIGQAAARGDRDRRQRRATGDIAERKNMRLAGALVEIRLDETLLVHFDAGMFQL